MIHCKLRNSRFAAHNSTDTWLTCADKDRYAVVLVTVVIGLSVLVLRHRRSGRLSLSCSKYLLEVTTS